MYRLIIVRRISPRLRHPVLPSHFLYRRPWVRPGMESPVPIQSAYSYRRPISRKQEWEGLKQEFRSFLKGIQRGIDRFLEVMKQGISG